MAETAKVAVTKSTINHVARQHLKELRQRGIELTDDEILWIVELCERVIKPDSRGDILALCGFGTQVGATKTTLYPLTIGAAIWLQECADEWFADNPSRSFYALAWALAHGRDKDAMEQAFMNADDASRLIRKWARGLTCTVKELEQAIDRILKTSDDDTGTTDRPDIDWARILTEIEAATGMPAQHWLWGASLGHTMRTWVAVRERMVLMAGGKMPRVDALTDALKALAKAKLAIWNRHLKDNGYGQESN